MADACLPGYRSYGTASVAQLNEPGGPASDNPILGESAALAALWPGPRTQQDVVRLHVRVREAPPMQKQQSPGALAKDVPALLCGEASKRRVFQRRPRVAKRGLLQHQGGASVHGT